MPRIADVHIRTYDLPLTAPIDLGGTVIRSRRGALVGVDLADGPTGWGDVAPLPGFSREPLDGAVEALRAQTPELAGLELSMLDPSVLDPSSFDSFTLDSSAHVSSAHDLSVPGRSGPGGPDAKPPSEPMAFQVAEVLDGLFGDAHTGALPPSARFGIEQATLSALALWAGVSLAETMSALPRSVVSLNALLMGDPREVRRDAERIAAEGYRAAKLKVGRRTVAADAALVRELSSTLTGQVALRLDANRAWTYEEALRFAEAVDGVPIEYVEEPLQDASRLDALSRDTGLSIALDETTREVPPSDLVEHNYASAFVVKPMLLGLTPTLDLARQVTGPDIVVSSAYETGVGLAGLVALAASMGARDVPVGLDTYRRLQRDVLPERLPLDGPYVDVRATWQTAAHAPNGIGGSSE